MRQSKYKVHMMSHIKMRFVGFKRLIIFIFLMKEINDNTLFVVRKNSIKRLSSGKVKQHCHDLKVTIVGSKNILPLVQEVIHRKRSRILYRFW